MLSHSPLLSIRFRSGGDFFVFSFSFHLSLFRLFLILFIFLHLRVYYFLFSRPLFRLIIPNCLRLMSAQKLRQRIDIHPDFMISFSLRFVKYQLQSPVQMCHLNVIHIFRCTLPIYPITSPAVTTFPSSSPSA